MSVWFSAGVNERQTVKGLLVNALQITRALQNQLSQLGQELLGAID